jgi:2-polyprenyl-3-methyl-5-hydroxy-6-metoxy-1,4-benzoquinol methylase
MEKGALDRLHSFEGTIESFPEALRSRAELLARARELVWYHSLRLDDSFTTQGYFTLDEFVPYYLIPESLAGLDCLDVGTGNGYWSFLMERRGARSVTATDIGAFADTDFSRVDSRTAPPARSPDGAFGEPYRLAATLLASRVRYRIASVYDLSPHTIGDFDFVFCGSMLMHIFAPLLALQRMAAVCRNTMVLTTQTDLALDGESVSAFMGHQIPYVHFVPSPTCLVNMVRCCGYDLVLRGPTFYLRYRDERQYPTPLCHTTVIALKSATRAAIPLPEARRYRDSERTARLEIVDGPRRISPGQVFDLIVRVENVSGVGWRGGASQEFRLDGEMTAAERGVTKSAPAPAQVTGTSFVDFLPAGLSTLARLRVRAPLWSGVVGIRPRVVHGAQRFDTNDAVHEVMVKPEATGWASLPARWLGSPRLGQSAWYDLARRVGRKLLPPRTG